MKMQKSIGNGEKNLSAGMPLSRKGKTMRIMIVESDWHFEIKAIQYFEARADLVVRRTPDAALQCAQSWQPELVILAAGYVNESLIAGLRALSVPPAILITEHMSRFDQAWRAWQVGGDELLMKPVFHVRELHEAVMQAMERAAINNDKTAATLAVPA